MGLTINLPGFHSCGKGLEMEAGKNNNRIVALAGNPNVGKSTVFNELTGLKQHTGNWAGKTVSNAQGVTQYKGIEYTLVDLPGTYSLMAHSKEEEVARDFICFGSPDAVIVVCDATCLERNLNLVLQTIEIMNNVVVCVNLMDEAQRKEIKIDLGGISRALGVAVVGAAARSGKGLKQMMAEIEKTIEPQNTEKKQGTVQTEYSQVIEDAIAMIVPVLEKHLPNHTAKARWIALRILENNEKLVKKISNNVGFDVFEHDEIKKVRSHAWDILRDSGFTAQSLEDEIVSTIIRRGEEISRNTVKYENAEYNTRDRMLDAVLTNRVTGIPAMVALLALVFWITISGANYLSQVLSDGLFWIEDRLVDFFVWAGAPAGIYGIFVFGIYRVVAWVVSVMLPPMAIFFPLFTLLEDLGYLPRIAFNLDKTFKKCSACGKQALTMCMGFGCNAAGVIGCRIIDSPRERLIAILTNNFVPCNGRFPTLIAIITMFFIVSDSTSLQSAMGAVLLTCFVMLGIFATFFASWMLSRTVLKGVTSSFTLELPPYRTPRIGRIIVRSVFDRTLFVLGRAVIVAAPAGLVLWVFANTTVGDASLLTHCSDLIDPFAMLLGLDGIILIAFILALPANEIVVPIIIMAYLSEGSILEIEDLTELKQLLVDNGWTWLTAINVMLFSLIHWPCSTTLLTIRKETGSWKWTALSFALPTLMGISACFIFTSIIRLFT